MTDRISSFSQTSQLIKNNLRVESEYAKKQEQISSGQKSESYQGIATDTQRILSLESDYNRITAQSENTETALNRTQASYKALGEVITRGQAFAADLNAAISSTGVTDEQLAQLAEQVLEGLASSLNEQLNGRFLFGGSATKTPPIDLTDPGFGGATYTAPGPSLPNTEYYQGNDYQHSVEASDGFVVNYGITADSPEIEQIIRAYDLIRTTPDDEDTLIEALNLLQDGLDNLATTQAGVAQTSNVLDAKIDENLEEINLLDSLIVDMKEVDLAEVSIQLQALEAQLEASYAVTTKLLNLNLTDYI